MLIVPEPAYVNEGGGGPGAINMLIVPEPVFPYYLSMYSCYDVYLALAHWFPYISISLWFSYIFIILVVSVVFLLYIFSAAVFFPLRYTWVTCSLITCSYVHGTVPAQIFQVL